MTDNTTTDPRLAISLWRSQSLSSSINSTRSACRQRLSYSTSINIDLPPERTVIALVGGKDKQVAICAALLDCWINRGVADEECAESLLVKN